MADFRRRIVNSFMTNFRSISKTYKMFIIFYLLLTLLGVSLLLLLIPYLLRPQRLVISYSSPFECGFTPITSNRPPFSLRFFLLCVLFLIFDVELVLLIPLVWMSVWRVYLWFAPLTLFTLVLLLGLYHEWNEGAIDWANI